MMRPVLGCLLLLIFAIFTALPAQARISPNELQNLIQQDLRKRAPQADTGASASAGGGGGGGAQQPPQSSAQPPPANSASAGSSGAAPPQTASASGSGGPPLQQGGGDALGGLPTSSSFGNTIYPGSASFLTPTGSASVSPLFRIDARENITFVWEYESVSVRPANLTLAAVAPNSITYTIAALQGGATSAVWRIADIPQESPLMNGMYGVQLYDQRGVSASPSPGWLSPHTSLTIAFYSGENYANVTDTAGNDCPRCLYDAASSLKAYGTAFGVALVTSSLFIYGMLY